MLKFKMDASCELEAGDPEREDRGEEEGLHYQANLQLEFAFGSLGLYVPDLSICNFCTNITLNHTTCLRSFSSNNEGTWSELFEYLDTVLS